MARLLLSGVIGAMTVMYAFRVTRDMRSDAERSFHYIPQGFPEVQEVYAHIRSAQRMTREIKRALNRQLAKKRGELLNKLDDRRASGQLKPESNQLARRESFGFMEAEEDELWALRKVAHQSQMKIERVGRSLCSHCRGALWWAFHYEPTFSCGYEIRVGSYGDGGKWVCNPHRIAQLAQSERDGGCLVYSVGSMGDYGFEESINDEISSTCEIHTFDLKPWNSYTDKPPPDFMHYHVAALGIQHPAKSLPEIVVELGHVGRRIDILKIDCEGCEWSTFRGWLGAGVDIRQILVELHDSPDHPVDDTTKHAMYDFLFEHGYVVFHKESNSLCGGDCIEYAFIKLGVDFGELHADGSDENYMDATLYSQALSHLPVVTCDVVLTGPGNKTMLLKRKNKPLQGQFYTLGGRMLKRESIAQCAVRQLNRELGLEVAAEEIQYAGVMEEHFTASEFDGVGGHFINSVFVLRLSSTDEQQWTLDRQHSEAKWFDIQDTTLHLYVQEKLRLAKAIQR